MTETEDEARGWKHHQLTVAIPDGDEGGQGELRVIRLSSSGHTLVVSSPRCLSPSLLVDPSVQSASRPSLDSPRVAFAPLPTAERSSERAMSSSPLGVSGRAAMLGPRKKLDAEQEAQKKLIWTAGSVAFGSPTYDELYSYDQPRKPPTHRTAAPRRLPTTKHRTPRARLPTRRPSFSSTSGDGDSDRAMSPVTYDELDDEFLRELKATSLDPRPGSAATPDAWEDI